jgi:polyhydroxyalkanoate synthesis regulator phasin
MAARKRASTRSQLLKRAVKAGRSALRNAEKRVPPDLRKQIERSVEDGQKTVHAAIKRVQTQLDRTARQADLDKVLKRLEGLSRQVQDIAGTAAAAATAPPTPTKAPRKPATTRKPAPRKPAARRAAPRKTATSTRPAARRSASRAGTAVRSAPPPPEPGPVPERMDSEEPST